MKVKHLRKRSISRWEHVKKDVTQKEGRTKKDTEVEKELCGDTDGEAWLLDNPHKMTTSQEEAHTKAVWWIT